MNFEVFTTSVELQDIPSYTTNITLEGQALRLSFLWNERLSKRVLSVKSSTDVTYLQNTILYPNESFELNSNAVFDDLPYKVVLQKTGDVNRVGNLYNWSKDYILVFYRTIDIETTPLNVRYGVTTPSTPTLPKPFGDWILNQGYTLIGDDIRYTGYKTNQVRYYDSFADFDLVTALVRSFYDSDMQTWQGFTNAVDELTGTVDWVFDGDNTRISYLNPESLSSQQYLWYYSTDASRFKTPEQACRALYQLSGKVYGGTVSKQGSESIYTCQAYDDYYGWNYDSGEVFREVNTTYDPSKKEYISFLEVANKILSNASSSDQAVSLMAEAYIEIVLNSIFSTDESKQFVKLSDLIPQLEANKVLRA